MQRNQQLAFRQCHVLDVIVKDSDLEYFLSLGVFSEKILPLSFSSTSKIATKTKNSIIAPSRVYRIQTYEFTNKRSIFFSRWLSFLSSKGQRSIFKGQKRGLKTYRSHAEDQASIHTWIHIPVCLQILFKNIFRSMSYFTQ